MTTIDRSEEVGREGPCVIAICTYKRPLLLESLLKEIFVQDFSTTGGRVDLLIIDNDPEQSAKKVYDEIVKTGSDLPVLYLPVQPQGLVMARNAALDFADLHDAVLIFIDDDELPDEGWFASFWQTHLMFPEDVIAGPVIPRFEAKLPSWCQDGSYWQRETFDDGAILGKPTGDGNILYPRNFVNGWRYSPRFNTSGAQDTHLLKKWIGSGGRLRWSAQAKVTEIVPEGRLTLTYALDRAYFSSLAYVWVDREMGSTVAWTILRVVRRLCIGIKEYLVALLQRDYASRQRALLHFSTARGTLDGLRLKSFDRYADYQIDAPSS
ncbi:glycosyltransferase family 2 protein [Arthrobacter sp. 8AJ]|uniref:glycosyltransferase family 2 protein n=1 Tax=Arthrobacter sp. 8AJ TaxID=2653130 RepID=UPI0012F021D6|nr:glycosyltransferase [Arthrobacter sp. 8AJ]VXC55281.1 conserved hypothetical protein [Arthrobacter sp. 8AJ]